MQNRIASIILLFVLPLWYSPLTQDLSLQKNALLALGLCFASLSLGWWSSIFLAAGAALSLLFPAGTAVILPLFTLPALVSFFRESPADCWLWMSAALLCLLGFLQWLGLDLFTGSTSSFSLPYAPLTATLGNPNYLALFLFFTLVLLYERHREGTLDRNGSGTELVGEQNAASPDVSSGSGAHPPRPPHYLHIKKASAALALIALILLAHSFLAWLVLLLFLAGVLWMQRRYAVLLVGASFGGALLFVYREGLLRALDGRLYLTQVYLSSVSSDVWLQGVGPGREASAFLHWQAAFLQINPEMARFWTYPEYAHNDVLSLAVTWGVMSLAALVALAIYHNRIKTDDARFAALMVVLVLLAALGATVLYIAPVLVVAAALLARATEAKRESNDARAKWVALPAALILLLMTSLQAYSDHLSKSAIEAAMKRDFGAAHMLVAEARSLPFQEAQLLFLRGRILVEERDFQAAKEPLQRARESFPHPEVLRLLAFACLQTKEEALLQEVLSQWKIYAPNDKTREKFLPPNPR